MSKTTTAAPSRIQPTAERRETAIAMMAWAKAPMTEQNLLRLAKKYEASYRRWRSSKRPPSLLSLMGAIQNARVFYSLARAAARGGK